MWSLFAGGWGDLDGYFGPGAVVVAGEVADFVVAGVLDKDFDEAAFLGEGVFRPFFVRVSFGNDGDEGEGDGARTSQFACITFRAVRLCGTNSEAAA